MNNSRINLNEFRRVFNIPSDFIRSTCKILDIEISRINKELFIPLENHSLNIENDTVLLFAFLESKNTGRIRNTKDHQFSGDAFNTCAEEVKVKRFVYVFVPETSENLQVTKKPKDSIDVSSSSVDLRKEEFISMLVETVSKSIANQSKPILNTHEELQKAVDKKWLLTNEQLANLLGMSKSTIGSKPDEWVRMGFKYSKTKEGNLILWRVSQC